MGILTLLALGLLGVEPEAPKGHLVIVGGGAAAEEIRRQTLELAGGPEARVVIIRHASGDPQAGERARQKWQDADAKHITVLELDDPAKAVAEVQAADLIFFLGGSQSKLMNALANTGVPDAIRDPIPRGGGHLRHQRRGRRDVPRDDRRQDRRTLSPRIAEGLGLWPEVIVDQHFLRRNREGRLRNAVLGRPDLIGVGIDEATAVMVSGRVFQVIGASSVVVMDARSKAGAVAIGTGQNPAQGAPLVESPNVQMHLLKAGMKYDLDKGILSN
jgi:cyanophycinase